MPLRPTASITIGISLLVAAALARAETISVHRVAPPEGRLTQRAGRLNVVPLAPKDARHLADLARLWRAHPDQLSRGHVNWSRHATRRRGWVRPHPMHVIQNGVEAVVTPPDTIRVAFLRFDFLRDRGGSASSGDGFFDVSGPDPTLPPIDRPPHNRTFYLDHVEALRRYHEAQAYGRTLIRGDVWPHSENGAYHLTDMADFGPWQFSQDIYPQARDLFRTMLFAADSQSIALGERIPWDKIDRIVLLHAGSDLQSDVSQDSKEDMPTFTLGVADTDVVWMRNVLTTGDSIPVDRATIAPETETQDGYYAALNGVLAHECGHLFYGFVDMYNWETGLPVVGFWSLMDSGNQVGSIVQQSDGSQLFATGLLPPSIDPYQRQITNDVMVPLDVSYTDTTVIANSERNPDLRRVRLSSDEYLLIENRNVTPTPAVELNQSPTTHVVLGPTFPDSLEYDALLPGGGMLVWHVDESVIPFESYFPLDTSLRVNPDFGVNTNPARLGLSVIEADGLGDLGDLSSPFILGSPFDPFFLSNNALLSDTTHPNLIPNTKTRPHVTLQFVDDQGPVMKLVAQRAWQLPGWPITTDFPSGGPQLLVVDADGDAIPDICWAGGDARGPDSTALFAVHWDGTGLFGPELTFATLDRPPMPVMAAIPTGEFLGSGLPTAGPSLFAVTTRADGPDVSTPGGRVWLLDHFGQPVPGWPVTLPGIATTPPVLIGIYPAAFALVGCADGRVYALRMDGSVFGSSSALAAPITGRLAAFVRSGTDSCLQVACADTAGDVAVFDIGSCPLPLIVPGDYLPWTHAVGTHGWNPDFLWIKLDGDGTVASPVCSGASPQLAVRGADRIWAFCGGGSEMPGWGQSLGDTLVPGLAGGDVDGDGFPEVIAQTIHSRVLFVNRTGRPSPGWPKTATREDLRAECPPLALDLENRGHPELVALNGSGMLAAFDESGHEPPGWPLATGAGAVGAPVATDFNSADGMFEIIAPDHLGRLYAYSLALPASGLVGSPWSMLGGDAGRSSALPAERTSSAPAPAPGPLVRGSFAVYPNPARRSPVSFAYALSEPSRVEFELVDTSGHRVASFSRDGHQGGNLESWDPGRLPGGLYVARVKFHGVISNREHREIIPVGVLR